MYTHMYFINSMFKSESHTCTHAYIHTYIRAKWVMPHTWMSRVMRDTTLSYAGHDSFTWDRDLHNRILPQRKKHRKIPGETHTDTLATHWQHTATQRKTDLHDIILNIIIIVIFWFSPVDVHVVRVCVCVLYMLYVLCVCVLCVYVCERESARARERACACARESDATYDKLGVMGLRVREMETRLCSDVICDTTHSYVMWLTHICHRMTYSYTWHDLLIRVRWLIHMCHMTCSYVWQDSFICVTWIILMCGMTQSYVWHDSFICVAWLIHTCDMTHSYVWHDSIIRVTWLFHMRETTHSYAWHDSFNCVPWPIRMRDATHSYAWHASSIWTTCIGKPRPVFAGFFPEFHFFQICKKKNSFALPWSFDVTFLFQQTYYASTLTHTHTCALPVDWRMPTHTETQ